MMIDRQQLTADEDKRMVRSTNPGITPQPWAMEPRMETCETNGTTDEILEVKAGQPCRFLSIFSMTPVACPGLPGLAY